MRPTGNPWRKPDTIRLRPRCARTTVSLPVGLPKARARIAVNPKVARKRPYRFILRYGPAIEAWQIAWQKSKVTTTFAFHEESFQSYEAVE